MKKILLVVCVMAIAMLALYGTSYAITGECYDCHTMHNSQGGVTENGQANGRPNLLKGSCIPCHTTTAAVAANARVDQGAGNELAGGTFTSGVASSDAKKHNVVAYDGDADTIAPPGYDSAEYTGAWTSSQPVSCAGTHGCHGSHSVEDPDTAITGFHHGGVSGGPGYRFLRIGSAAGSAVTGKGSVDYEKAGAVVTNHNVYGAGADGISALCNNCHGNFHGTGAAKTGSGSPWLRHPTDLNVTLADGTADVDYVQTPFAFAAATVAALTTSGAYTTANAQVACVSCHRAHGSAEDDLLRFSYSAVVAGNSADNGGCENCHSAQE